MKTIIKKVNKEHPEADIICQAGDILKKGGLVAFPTETVYGLGANALDEEAAMKTYAAKGRPSDNPLIVHIADMKDLPKIVTEIPEAAKKVAERYWPGPLTMIFQKSDLDAAWNNRWTGYRGGSYARSSDSERSHIGWRWIHFRTKC